jgi:hypothetical protein
MQRRDFLKTMGVVSVSPALIKKFGLPVAEKGKTFTAWQWYDSHHEQMTDWYDEAMNIGSGVDGNTSERLFLEALETVEKEVLGDVAGNLKMTTPQWEVFYQRIAPKVKNRLRQQLIQEPWEGHNIYENLLGEKPPKFLQKEYQRLDRENMGWDTVRDEPWDERRDIEEGITTEYDENVELKNLSRPFDDYEGGMHQPYASRMAFSPDFTRIANPSRRDFLKTMGAVATLPAVIQRMGIPPAIPGEATFTNLDWQDFSGELHGIAELMNIDTRAAADTSWTLFGEVLEDLDFDILGDEINNLEMTDSQWETYYRKLTPRLRNRLRVHLLENPDTAGYMYEAFMNEKVPKSIEKAIIKYRQEEGWDSARYEFWDDRRDPREGITKPYDENIELKNLSHSFDDYEGGMHQPYASRVTRLAHQLIEDQDNLV